MKYVLFAALAAIASNSSYGGFWDAVNRVQKTVDTVNAVGDLIKGGNSSNQVQPAQPVETPAPAPAAPAREASAQASPVPEAPVTATPAPAVPAAPDPASPAPATQPVRQASADVQAAAVPAVSDADMAAFAAMRTKSTDTAEPEFEWGAMTFTKPATPEQIAAARQKIGDKASGGIKLVFEKADEATVTAAILQFPNATQLSLRETKMSSLSVLALLTKATTLDLHDLDALSYAPLAGLQKVVKLTCMYCTVEDLSPFSGWRNLEDVNFYGAKLQDFSPLASCPKLRKVDFYAVKMPPEKYATLGTLKQVKEFHGGLTKMTSIAWLSGMTQVESVQIFAEKIDSYAPLATLPNLRKLRLWNQFGGEHMSTAVGDLAPILANAQRLEKLELPGSRYTNATAIGALKNLTTLDLSGAKEPVDVSFVTQLPKLKSISLRDTTVVNGSAVAALPKKVRVSTDKNTKGL